MSNDPNLGVSRRGFLAASGAIVGTVAAGGRSTLASEASGDKPARPMIKIAEVLRPPQDALWRMVKQCGVDYVDGAWQGDWDAERAPGEMPWHYGPLSRLKQAYEAGGFQVTVIESRPPMNKVKLGLPGRDQEIEDVKQLIRNMGRLGIGVWCYEWMAEFNWLRTNKAVPTRGGALTTGFDVADTRDAPLTRHGVVREETLWNNLQYFLERVVPVAEEANVKLAMHPDDPPLSPIRGIPRIMRSIENYQRLLDLAPSPVNGIALCQGNFALMTDDLPGVIRRFGGQKKIFFVHFRDVKGTPERFVETFHDAGQTDMAACMCAYRDIGYDGICRPDHVPTMEGDSNLRPGYSSIGRLFAIGYIKGLEAVYSEPRT